MMFSSCPLQLLLSQKLQARPPDPLLQFHNSFLSSRAWRGKYPAFALWHCFLMSRYLYNHPKPCVWAEEIARNKNAAAGGLLDVLDFDRPILEHRSSPSPTTLLVCRTLAVMLESTSRAHGSLLSRFHWRMAAAIQVLGQEQQWPKRPAWHPGCGCPQQASRQHGCNSGCPWHSLGERGRGNLASSFG